MEEEYGMPWLVARPDPVVAVAPVKEKVGQEQIHDLLFTDKIS